MLNVILTKYPEQKCIISPATPFTTDESFLILSKFIKAALKNWNRIHSTIPPKSTNLKILAQFRPAYTIRHKPQFVFLTKLRKLMLHFRPHFCSVAACGCASPITEAPLLVLAQPLQSCWAEEKGCFSFPAARKVLPSQRCHGKLLCGQGRLSCSAPQHASFFQLTRDYRAFPQISLFYTFLCLDGLIQVLSALLEGSAQKYWDMGTWFLLWIKCGIVSPEAALQY